MRTSHKFLAGVTAVSLAVVLAGGSASAHVTVKPAEVAPSAFQTFTVGVPVEKDVPTTAVKLVMPEGVKYVTPTVKPGWQIATDKTGTGENAVVKSITWTGGSIGAGLRDEFTFSAQAPSKDAELTWKAYQTYQDGSVVAWDKQPSEDAGHEEADSGPYSVTTVDEAAAAVSSTGDIDPTAANDAKTMASTALYVAIAGLLIGLASLFLATRSGGRKSSKRS